MRASHTHHVPQVGFPQIAPVTKATAVSTAPTGAAARIVTSELVEGCVRVDDAEGLRRIGVSSAEASEQACFVPGALEPAAPAARFAAATPYTHVRLPAVFDDALLRRVRKELAQLHRTFKETDLFKVRVHRGGYFMVPLFLPS